jgi:hypothetical protein
MRMFHNKKGIELSINFIVMLILAIAVFAGGLVFTSKFFSHAEKVRGSLDSQTERQIEKLLDSGSPVVIPINTKEIHKKNHDTFGVGVLADTNGKYSLHTEFADAFRKDKSDIDTDANSWIIQPDQDQDLEKNEKGKFLVGIEVPKDAEKGTYIFRVTVELIADIPEESDPQYDNPSQFIVRVP